MISTPHGALLLVATAAGGHLRLSIERMIRRPRLFFNLQPELAAGIRAVARVYRTRRHEDEALEVAWNDRMEGRRNLYRFVVQWLKRDGLLSPEWDNEVAVEMVWALTSWQVWEQLVMGQGWPKERYEQHLGMVLRRALVVSQEK